MHNILSVHHKLFLFLAMALAEMTYVYHIVENFQGENIHEFRGFRVTRKSFLHEIGCALPIYDRY